MAAIFKFSRRDFLKISAATGAGLILGAHLPGCGDDKQEPGPGVVFVPSIFLSIDSDGIATVFVPRSELGQGVRTSLPMLVAEELDVDWADVRCEGVEADDKYGSMSTGGSTSIRDFHDTLLDVGAAARAMLVSAAAMIWKVDESTCSTANSEVIHAASDRRLAYGELVSVAKDLAVPADFTRKDPADYTLLGTAQPRLDTPAKVDGSAVFGIDVRVPGMLFAVVARPPIIGGSVSSIQSDAALAVSGVREVVEISTGVAVVAENTFAAIKGRDALQVTWDDGPNADLDDAGLSSILDQKSQETPQDARRDGDPEAALAAAALRLDQIYEVPFLAHAAMEPMNCVADVKTDSCEIWAPTQDPQGAARAAALVLGLTSSKVTVHTTLSGGGFGCRHRQDYVEEAVEISRAVLAPVQMVCTREDDMRHGYYRPFSRHLLSGGLDAQNNLTALSHVAVAPSISSQLSGNPVTLDQGAVQGLRDTPYGVDNLYVGYVNANTPVPIIWWRSVYMSQNPFANECFLDELAEAAGRDPLEFRTSLLGNSPRQAAVLNLAAEKAGWGGALPAGHGQGIACASVYNSFIAQVAEVSTDVRGVTVHKVVCAVDCGRVVNPDIVAQQMESGIVYGLSAALSGKITISGGSVQEGNFDFYPVLHFEEMPVVEVYLIDSTEPVGGIGELAIPPIAPAVANAVYAVTKTRVRKLPIGQV